MKPYVQIADRIAMRIANGELPLGARLPPQRIFAYDEGIAVSTASRVYDELRRRGLVTGEVGRGTFVSSRFTPLDPAMQEPSRAGIDLEIVFRLSAASRDALARSTAKFFKSGLSHQAVSPASARADTDTAQAIAKHAGQDATTFAEAPLLLTGNGKQAIAAALSAIAGQGGRVGVEALTYPFVISVARTLGIELVPLALDDEGIEPAALDRAAEQGLSGVYLQPVLQSPLVLTMSEARKRAIAVLLERHDVIAIEDRIYSFLKPSPPLAELAPAHVIQVDSLSKRLMPGLSLGMIVAPDHLSEAVETAIRSGGWMAPSLSVALARHWIEDGVVRSIEADKRSEVREMYAIAEKAFEGLSFNGAPEALHLWLELPKGWRAEAFCSACAEVGIAVAPGSAFAVGKSIAPAGVRIACSASDMATWEYALGAVANLARQKL